MRFFGEWTTEFQFKNWKKKNPFDSINQQPNQSSQLIEL